MLFKELQAFIQKKMRMSAVYQPVMIMTLLRNGGSCSKRKLAKALLSHDESQIEYYEAIITNMVGKVLLNHKVVARDAKTKTYTLPGFEGLTKEQIATLTALCQARLDAFLAKRGEALYDHRRNATGYVSGTIRYDVLKRARFRCELCGISAEEKALEVDHIIPRSKGGSDDLSNFQALCYSCNAMKRDRDDTDFRIVRESYAHRDETCPFCEIGQDRIIGQNELAYAIRDGYPVTQHHSLIIPKRHVTTYFELGQAEINACTRLMQDVRKEVSSLDPTVDGFNVGINTGSTAGQTVPHCHIHLIPRRVGDVADPIGGVRNVIPGKGNYKVLSGQV